MSRAEHVLTPRQAEVVRLIGIGLTNLQIAGRLGVREKTVRTHVTDVLTKLRIHDGNRRVHLARWVWRVEARKRKR